MVDRISAADNLTIELETDRWRLIANGGMEESVVVEAAPGKPLRYIAGFGRTRRLPENGALPVEHIQRVVLGWSQQDEAWHLGFVLASELAQARGSRWCEVAHWPDPETNIYDEIALLAGKSLAQAITRPFYLVPPQEAARPTTAAPTRPLPEPPLKLDSWTFQRAESGYELVRSARYALTCLRRIVWYSLWTAVYVVLVYTTFNAGIAPARPEWLPYLGIASAVLLVGLILRNIYRLLTEPNRIVIDSSQHVIRAYVDRRQRWQYFASDQVLSVYVSQMTHKVGRRGEARQVVGYGELNLQLQNNKFHYILNLEQPAKTPLETGDPIEHEDGIVELSAHNVQTPLQATGVYIAQALGVPCHYDHRT